MTVIQQAFHSVKKINLRLFTSLVLLTLLPTIYLTLRINYLGSLPGDWGYNIASQMSWVSLFYEVIQEGLVLPLFFLLGSSLLFKEDLANKVRTGLLITFTVYTILSTVLIIFADPLVRLMAQTPDLIDETVIYVRWESVASIFSTLWRYLLLVFITLKKEKYLYISLIVQLLLTAFLDMILLSSLSFSLNLGVNAIAYTNIIVNLILVGLSIYFLKSEKIVLWKKNLDFSWLKSWWHIGKFSGLESFVRNLAFSVMIIRLINQVSEQGNYWVANSFIWGWLLIPVLALGDLVKKEVAEDEKKISQNTLGYFFISIIIVSFWVLSIPLWSWFLQSIMNISNPETILSIIYVQLFFYITFAFNNVIDSIFYGIGRTDYMLYQSLFVNVIFFGGAFILYLLGVFQPTITAIALMFGIGLLFDAIPTVYLFYRLLKKKNIILFSTNIPKSR
jgi:Na+-driven multidrug efflux pump